MTNQLFFLNKNLLKSYLELEQSGYLALCKILTIIATNVKKWVHFYKSQTKKIKQIKNSNVHCKWIEKIEIGKIIDHEFEK